MTNQQQFMMGVNFVLNGGKDLGTSAFNLGAEYTRAYLKDRDSVGDDLTLEDYISTGMDELTATERN